MQAPSTFVQPLKSPFSPKSSLTQIRCNTKSPYIPTSHKPYSPQQDTLVIRTTPTKQSFVSQIFKSIEDLIRKLDSPLHPSIDPKHVLSGNFAPVHELPPTPCHVVEGALPTALNGAYIRNGPNPQFQPDGPYHLLDGDGMLHAVTISNGVATFCSRYVKTHKFLVEKEMGYPFWLSPFSSFNGPWASIARSILVVARALAGYFHPMRTGFGMANTSLAMFGGALFALCEVDLPYRVKVSPAGDIITLSRHHLYDEDNPPLCMTAHPKIDHSTGEAFAFRCHIFAPFLTFFKIDSSGRKLGPDIPIQSITKPSFVHDFAITNKFIVFQDFQVGVNPMEIVRGRSPLAYFPDKVPRVGILPRKAKDESGLVWVETAGFNMMHVINAWEEKDGDDDRIVIVAPNVLSIRDGLEKIASFESVVEKVTIDLRTKNVVRERLSSERMLEFGVISPAFAGKRTRYVYSAIIDEMPKARGLVKLDLSLLQEGRTDCTVASCTYGPGCYGGEPYFVANEPKDPAGVEEAEEEDDGYLVTYVHNENTGQSWFLVMDAKSQNLDVVAKIKLPGRVPYGFHGLFVKETDLRNL